MKNKLKFAPALVTCGLGSGQYCTPCDLWTLAKNIVDFLVKPPEGIAFPVLVLALLIGGVVWATSAGNPNRIELGKKVITSSIVGIFIAFGGWLIVDTIINTLVSGSPTFAWQKIEGCKSPIVTPPPTPAPPPTPTGGIFQTEEEARAYFKNLGFTDADLKPPCASGQTTGCLNLVGLPKETAVKLWQLETQCASLCPFRISAGTEGGHQTHGPGKAVVDIVPKNQTPSAFSILRGTIAAPGSGVVARCEAQGGAPTNCGASTNHIHVVFP